MTREPKTLEEVQKGDLVWVFRGEPYQVPVIGVTSKTLVIDEASFRRDTGISESPRGTWLRDRAFIAVGPEAAKKMEKYFRESRRHKTWLELLRASPRIEQQTVMDCRAICDSTERFLREIGEWEDTQ